MSRRSFYRVRFASFCLAAAQLSACGDARFPLRDPLMVDTDMRPVSVDCEKRPSKEEPEHISCAPEPYVSPLAWDGADNMVFRPFANVFAVQKEHEAVNVNALDEVPDSAWFTNRIGRSHPSREELLRGACTTDEMLKPEQAVAGSWVIDKGKTDGASLGFRVRTPNGGKFMLKNDAPGQPERASAASAIGAAIYHAVGFNTSCEQIVYFDRKLLKLNPGLHSTDNSGRTRPFDQKRLDHVLSEANRSGDLYRMQASAWLPGYLLGPFRYEGTRCDDPNDTIAHDERRDLRGGRVLAAWLNHFDAREQNSMDSWFAARPGPPDASPGYVRHYYIDTSDCFGSEWAWDSVSRRLGRSYILDWGDLAFDFVTLGIPSRPWDRARRRPGFELFGYFTAEDFDPDAWKNEYPNAAFSNATERDNAWMARILSRFERAELRDLVELGRFTKPEHAAYLADVLEGRLQRILERYFARLSPISDLRVTEADQLCGIDLARRRNVWPRERFRYSAVEQTSEGAVAVPILPGADGALCVNVTRWRRDPARAGQPRYVILTIRNGVSEYALRVHLFDRGAARGYRLLGLERPEEP